MANAAGTSTTLVTLGRATYPFQPHTSNTALDQIRRAGRGDHAGVMRELGEYGRFLGEEVDASGFDGVAGVMRIGVDPAGEAVGTAGVLGGRVLRIDSERRLEAAIRLYRSYGFKDIPDYNRNPRAEI